jgi:molybdopterin molybdotransferase
VISVEEALRILESATAALPVQDCPLGEALGRVLARDVASDVDWPPFDTSAMDGYAVRLADLQQLDRALPERSGIVAAGDAPTSPLAPGEVVRVMTGAPIPEGTEAIVPVERARRESGRVSFEAAPEPGAHIRRRGESIVSGTVLLIAGRRLAPGDTALAALAGADPVAVFRRPRVTIAVTGDELVEASGRPGAGQLRDSNGPMLAALCRASGLSPALAGRVADRAEDLERLFGNAGAGEDVLLTSGGVSAGDLDLLPGVARGSGFEILFHGVSVRPGKPIAFGRRNDTLWFGLPGNPVSTAVGFQLFVRYALDRLEGDARPGAPRVSARLVTDLRPAGSRETYRDAVVRAIDGELRVEPLATRGSHDIAAHARANALLRQPAGGGRLSAGSIVECVLVGQVDSRQSTVDSSR